MEIYQPKEESGLKVVELKNQLPLKARIQATAFNIGTHNPNKGIKDSIKQAFEEEVESFIQRTRNQVNRKI